MVVNEETGELEYEINERKRVEAVLREKKELLSNILAGSAVGIGVVEDRKLSWTNESMIYHGESIRKWHLKNQKSG